MLGSRLLLSSVAFGVSLSLSLLAKQDMNTALLTGAIAVPATFSGVLALQGKQRLARKPALTALRQQIYQMEQRENQLQQSLVAIAAEKHRWKININFLNAESSKIHTQIAEQRSCKQQLSHDITTLTEERQQLAAQLQNLQAQIESCEESKTELYQALRLLRAEKQYEVADYNSRQIGHQQLDVQITALQQQKHELEQSIEAIAQDKQTTEEHIYLLQTELQELQFQVFEQQKNRGELEQELSWLTAQKQQLQAELNPSEIPEEWTQFITHLTQPELQVLKAIAQQSDPSAEIKKIAEANITMPELLIDSINECALDTIGDLIVEPGTKSIPLGITEEYLTSLNKAFKLQNIN